MAHKDRFLSRDALEQLLADGPFDDPRLSELISAATAPAQPGELAGLDGAIAAFQSTPVDQAAARRRRVVLKTFASGVLGTKVLAGAVSAAAVGGVALAAGAGHIGRSAAPQGVAATHASPTAGATDSGPPTRSTTATSFASSTPKATHPAKHTTTSTPAVHPRATKAGLSAPSPALAGLCIAWKAHETHADSQGQWKTRSAFSVLIKAAGSTSAVDRYCTTLLATRPKPQPTPGPTLGHKQGKPIVLPTFAPVPEQPAAIPAHGGPE
jgi:hypothetical protein